MSRFFTKLFAVIGFCVVLLVLIGCGLGYYFQQQPNPEPGSIVLSLDFDEPIAEQASPSALDIALHDQTTPLFDVLRAIARGKADPHVKGIVAHFGGTQPSLAHGEEIRQALMDFRASGKLTYAFAPSYGDFGTGNRVYYIASAFENIWLQPVGAVGLTGVAVEMPFGKTALEKVGIAADFMQREEYKSAMDSVTRDDFAPQVRIETQVMIEDLASQIAAGIAESRKWDAARVKSLMAQGPYTDQEAFKAELVTHLGYADELQAELDEKIGKDVAQVSVEDYLAYDATPVEKPKAKVALIYGSGLIVDKADGPVGVPGEDHVMGADKLASAFDDAADAKDVDAILFRIDSPGGSPDASETIRHALIHAQKQGKPVIVSMGDVAASGGYWIAMNADRIIAEPATLTGSIGVLGGKFVIGGLLDKLGVKTETLKTDEGAGMWSMTEGFSQLQRARVNALLDQTYAIFTKYVSDARKIPMEKMPDIAKGRVWTGAQAVKIGLVDELGGYDVAVGEIRKRLKLGKDDAIDLQTFPAPESPFERVMKLVKSLGAESAMLGPLILEWQKLDAVLAPALRQATAVAPVQLRMRPIAPSVPQ
ncbi:MAG: signal peptide peptidase SppA [Pseudomonadota bacterium]|nr:signal peptide peptidase SppA [Pseudomonadota bacterium]